MLGAKITNLILTLICAFLFVIKGYGVAVAEILKRTDAVFTVEARGKVFEFCYPEIDFSNGELYLKNCEQVVDYIYYSTLTFPKNAELNCYPERELPFEYEKEKVGIGVDKRALLCAIEQALKNGTERVSDVKTIEIEPKVRVEDLMAETKKRAEFSTRYLSSVTSRKKNIALASEYLACVEIANGAEFSFNEIVGERTEERGFTSAKVIENGKFTEGVGGGVCQVSTTVYNCALLSGMNVTERHRHSLVVSYAQPSFDAMVSYAYADLRFENESGSTVYLVVDANGERVRARIYGVENFYRYKLISIVDELIEPLSAEVVYTDKLAAGETKQMVYPKKGVKSAGVVEKYFGDKLVEKKLLGTDEYSPLRGITLKGKE